MTSKKLLNSAQHVVDEMIEGAVISLKGVRKLEGWNVLVRDDIDVAKLTQVSIISGGGSGHEPSHGGWVGAGMLSAAVAGGVFASPSSQAVLSAILATSGPKGCLLIIKNYTGDRINFGLAAEQAKAAGIPVEMVVVGDDCALPNRTGGLAGRRGVAGTVFVHKVAGAAAEAGKSLEEVKLAAEHASSSIGTMGVALSVCTLPGQVRDSRLGDDQCEIGLGIHGEPGAVTTTMKSADELTSIALDYIFKQEQGWNYFSAAAGSNVALLVNNLGGSTAMELSVVARQAVAHLSNVYQLNVVRLLSGTFMSSLDMAGFSLTVFKLDEGLLNALDQNTSAPAWPNTIANPSLPHPNYPVPELISQTAKALTGPSLSQEHSLLFAKAVAAACVAIREKHKELNEWDSKVGDGDCGDTLLVGAEAITGQLSSIDFSNPAAAFSALGNAVKTMGGTSGAVYQILFAAAAGYFASEASSQQVTNQHWANAAERAVAAVSRYGGATSGDRTILDALIPAVSALKSGQSINGVSDAANQGATNTTGMKARAGRSSYVPEEILRTVPDPGAAAAAAWIAAVANALV
eukprot:c9277_g1_i1.p1 GENE.c9277_g1_i1~~c9277_g1_i1.p1  ORF type:complete len:576 (+),score=149.56 c9277_g1_i1:757-2484(+)